MITPTTSQFLGEMESVPVLPHGFTISPTLAMKGEDVGSNTLSDVAAKFPELCKPRTFSQMLPRPDEYFCL